MNQVQSLRISIIIPVYNEAAQLAACLTAIARQTVKPFEVIVVDNNSTDDSAAIAARFPFVRVMTERRQGVVHARTTGFDAACGDIIARIDADSLLPTEWLATVQQIMSEPTIAAVSGTAQYYNVAAARLFNTIDLFFRRRLARQLGNRVFLYGANMALQRSAWQAVRARLCQRGGQHEDYDIAIHLQELGERVVFDERLTAKISSRRIDVNFISFMRYVLVAPNTYAQHHIRARWHMYSLVALCAIGYLPARVLHRGYDPLGQHFSWLQLFSARSTAPRVDPTAYVA